MNAELADRLAIRILSVMFARMGGRSHRTR